MTDFTVIFYDLPPGVSALQQALLEEVDKKHKEERETMLEIMNAAEADTKNVEQAKTNAPGVGMIEDFTGTRISSLFSGCDVSLG
jgi:hypothetical protein